ncbi:hypothetical protein VPHD480_0173 [Vibrio phage D480]|nr:hypothetical protein MYOV011v1_p0039 [Vibrio phage 6E35.1a]
MKKFNEFAKELEEAATDIVYHGTSLSRAIEILSTDKFRLSDAKGSWSDDTDTEINQKQGKDKRYYLSTARSATSPYINDLDTMIDSTTADVLFVIDGRKISHNHRTKAVDYGRGEYASDYGNELEDRVFSKKPVIDNASKYIKEAHVWKKFSSSSSHGESILEKFLSQAKRKGIRVWVYDNQRDWQSMNKKRAVFTQ